MDKGVKQKVLKWNSNFPIDRWWREKHGIAFSSPAHREVSFMDMYFEYIEDSVYMNIEKKRLEEEEKPKKELSKDQLIKEAKKMTDQFKDMKF